MDNKNLVSRSFLPTELPPVDCEPSSREDRPHLRGARTHDMPRALFFVWVLLVAIGGQLAVWFLLCFVAMGAEPPAVVFPPHVYQESDYDVGNASGIYSQGIYSMIWQVTPEFSVIPSNWGAYPLRAIIRTPTTHWIRESGGWSPWPDTGMSSAVLEGIVTEDSETVVGLTYWEWHLPGWNDPASEYWGVSIREPGYRVNLELDARIEDYCERLPGLGINPPWVGLRTTLSSGTWTRARDINVWCVIDAATADLVIPAPFRRGYLMESGRPRIQVMGKVVQ